MLAYSETKAKNNEMESGYRKEDIQDFINRLVGSETLDRASQDIEDWNALLYEDVKREMEWLQDTYGQKTATLYIGGVSEAYIFTRWENGGLPDLSDSRYLLDREVIDSNLAAHDDTSADYFDRLEGIVHEKFHMTKLALLVRAELFVMRGEATEEEIHEGYGRGAQRILHAVAALLDEGKVSHHRRGLGFGFLHRIRLLRKRQS